MATNERIGIEIPVDASELKKLVAELKTTQRETEQLAKLTAQLKTAFKGTDQELETAAKKLLALESAEARAIAKTEQLEHLGRTRSENSLDQLFSGLDRNALARLCIFAREILNLNDPLFEDSALFCPLATRKHGNDVPDLSVCLGLESCCVLDLELVSTGEREDLDPCALVHGKRSVVSEIRFEPIAFGEVACDDLHVRRV